MKKNGELRGAAMGEGSRSDEGNRGWKELWQLRAPPRVQQFLWKCLHDILPTKNNIMKKRLLVDPLCVFCNSTKETLTHLLLECHFSCRLWYSTPWTLNTLRGSGSCFQDWWHFLVRQLKDRGAEELLSYIGCTLRREDTKWTTESVSTTIVEREQSHSRHGAEQGWRLPAEKYVKINCDVGWRKEQNSGSIGVVIRNERGVEHYVNKFSE
ncbi:hypothetical protein LIER_30252 [Lithospermum erythrorhizon]|uniref:Reverse transcriptase zinc-binding domain-containing protein n=1 Tax=Lithospermum erythrorhizon TaxID=34254 RepID=A0AAV3RM17_LITER